MKSESLISSRVKESQAIPTTLRSPSPAVGNTSNDVVHRCPRQPLEIPRKS
jgi:hypothetical protein